MRNRPFSIAGAFCVVVSIFFWLGGIGQLVMGPGSLSGVIWIIAALIAGAFSTLLRIARIVQLQEDVRQEQRRVSKAAAPDRRYDREVTPPGLPAVSSKPQKKQAYSQPVITEALSPGTDDAIARAEAEAFRRAAQDR